jgi:hypothetical protein
MADIIPIRDGLTENDLAFCRKIDELVDQFNYIADQEILEEPILVAEVTGLVSLEVANVEVAQSFQKNLTRITFPNKIESLKEAFGKIADLGMEALRDVEAHGSEYVERAIRHITHVLDVMNDDDSDYAPKLVTSDALYKDKKWTSLLEHRDDVSNALRDHLGTLYERESKEVLAHRI